MPDSPRLTAWKEYSEMVNRTRERDGKQPFDINEPGYGFLLAGFFIGYDKGAAATPTENP